MWAPMPGKVGLVGVEPRGEAQVHLSVGPGNQSREGKWQLGGGGVRSWVEGGGGGAAAIEAATKRGPGAHAATGCTEGELQEGQLVGVHHKRWCKQWEGLG